MLRPLFATLALAAGPARAAVVLAGDPAELFRTAAGTVERFRCTGAAPSADTCTVPAGSLALADTQFGAQYGAAHAAIQALADALTKARSERGVKADLSRLQAAIKVRDEAHLAALRGEADRLAAAARDLAATRRGLLDRLAALEAQGMAGTPAYRDALAALDANDRQQQDNRAAADANASQQVETVRQVADDAARIQTLDRDVAALDAQIASRGAELDRQRQAASDLYALAGKLGSTSVFPEPAAPAQRGWLLALRQDFDAVTWRGAPLGTVAGAVRRPITGTYTRIRDGQARSFPWAMAVRCAAAGANPGQITLTCATEIAYWPGSEGAMSDAPGGRFSCTFATRALAASGAASLPCRQDYAGTDAGGSAVTFTGSLDFSLNPAPALRAFTFAQHGAIGAGRDADDFRGGL